MYWQDLLCLFKDYWFIREHIGVLIMIWRVRGNHAETPLKDALRGLGDSLCIECWFRYRDPRGAFGGISGGSMGRIRDLMTPVSFRVRVILKCHPYAPEKQVCSGGLTDARKGSIIRLQEQRDQRIVDLRTWMDCRWESIVNTPNLYSGDIYQWQEIILFRQGKASTYLI